MNSLDFARLEPDPATPSNPDRREEHARAVARLRRQHKTGTDTALCGVRLTLNIPILAVPSNRDAKSLHIHSHTAHATHAAAAMVMVVIAAAGFFLLGRFGDDTIGGQEQNGHFGR